MKRSSTFLIGVILLATAMLGAHAAQAELIGHWKFDEVVGNVTPDSGPSARSFLRPVRSVQAHLGTRLALTEWHKELDASPGRRRR